MPRNITSSITLSINALKIVGFWTPRKMTLTQHVIYRVYFVFTFMFLLGTYLFIQVVDLFKIWGDLPLMTAAAFLLFTNLAHATKVFNLVWRKLDVQRIIDENHQVLSSEDSVEGMRLVQKCNRETMLQQFFYFFLTTVTIVGWAGSAEKNQLPLRAWYPYDTSKSPAYQLTYCHQVSALFIAAYLNIAKDTLVTTLTAQCRCRLQLISLSLRRLHHHFEDEKINSQIATPFTANQESVIKEKLRKCIKEHQATLQTVKDIQRCFSAPTFAQFTVSLVIICVTAFQLTSQLGNTVRLISMMTYLVNMSYQVFIYCYQGEMLKAESIELGGAAYECTWYRSSISLRRSLLNVMVRTRRPAILTAGGFTTLSLQSFMAIIKASYSFFTLLQQLDSGF